MQTQLSTPDDGAGWDRTDAEPVLRVVIAYDDLAAGKRAMRVMAEVGRGLGDEIEFRPCPWSFDLLADVDWCEVAAHDAINADILIIATSSASPLPPAVGRWADSAISGKQGTAAAVVALFGTEEDPDGAGSSRLQAIQKAALRAGLDFFAPQPRCGLDEVTARLHQRAEMIAPLLIKIPDCHPTSRGNAGPGAP